MEATLRFNPQLFSTGPLKFRGRNNECKLQLWNSLLTKNSAVSKENLVALSKRNLLSTRPYFSESTRKRLCVNSSSDKLQSNCVCDDDVISGFDALPPKSDDGAELIQLKNVGSSGTLQSKGKMFRNRFLDFVRMRSVLNNAAQSFFKSEIQQRLFVTAVLIVISRIGYYILLPGFDRRLIPQEYLSFVSGSVGV